MKYSELELKVINMVREGAPLHGLARDIAIDMQLDGRWPENLGR